MTQIYASVGWLKWIGVTVTLNTTACTNRPASRCRAAKIPSHYSTPGTACILCTDPATVPRDLSIAVAKGLALSGISLRYGYERHDICNV